MIGLCVGNTSQTEFVLEINMLWRGNKTTPVESLLHQLTDRQIDSQAVQQRDWEAARPTDRGRADESLKKC